MSESFEEIRIAIAKAKGWREVGGLLVPPEGDPRITWAAEWSVTGIPHWMPNWPESIADAWELAEEAHMIIYTPQYDGAVLYGAEHGDNYGVLFEGATAQLAICAAWLAWDAARKAEK